MISDKPIKDLYAEIIKHCRMRNSSLEDSEDIAQEVFLSWLSYQERHGKMTKQTIGQAVIDAKRKLFGETRVKQDEVRKAARFGIRMSLENIKLENDK